MTKLAPAVFVCAPLSFWWASSGFAQSIGSSGTIRGSVLDPSAAVIRGATIEIVNPVSQYNRTVATDAQGNFEIVNVPYNNYHLTVTASGFQTNTQDVDVR